MSCASNGTAVGPAAKSETGGCSGPATPCDAKASEKVASNGAVTHADVSEYYGKTVQSKGDLQTAACLLQGGLSAEERRLLANVHEEILSKFYGCGSPIPPLLEGLTMLDLGCGTGRDVYLAAQLVGEGGTAIGVDMTDEQLEVARYHEEWHREKFGFAKSNTVFRKGFIEDLKAAGIQDSSVDVVISNCVVNLAPDKAPVLAEIARVLKPGGELFFSDVYADRRIPEPLRKDKVLFGECLAGALYTEDFRRLMAGAGLAAWGVVSSRRLVMDKPDIAQRLGDIRFFEATVRAVKLGPGAEEDTDAPEDYGQSATYLGGIPQHEDAFILDQVRVFPKDATVRVDSATAATLRASRFGRFFTVSDPGAHRGAFRGWPRLPASVAGCADFDASAGAPKASCC